MYEPPMDPSDHPAKRFFTWFKDTATPLWMNVGYDHARGGFFEALDFQGAPILGQPKRVRVQTRQIYVTSRISAREWSADAEALSHEAFDFFLNNACPNDGAQGCVAMLTPEGEIADDTRDLYDQAFLLLACARRYQTFKDERALTLAEKTLIFLNKNLASPHGGWLESNVGAQPRRQNPHMHLFEAFMALFEATQDEQYLIEADKVYRLFTDHFFDRDNSILREYFSVDLKPAPDRQGLWLEPGHMVEWTALLNTYQKLRRVDTTERQKQLFENAVAIGSDEQTGFLVDGFFFGETARGPRRLWPQTEYLKACAAIGDEKSAGRMIGKLFDTYLDQPVKGLWCDQFDEDGNPCVDQVPASILYHLVDAALAVEIFLSAD
ncbi:MAG: AGE family epimerase/isomerase [Pseudomonadota bacterium]